MMRRSLVFVALFLHAVEPYQRKPIGGNEPASQSGSSHDTLKPFYSLPKASVSSVNRTKVALADEEREASGKPPRFAIANKANIDPNNGDGIWEVLDDDGDGSITHVWRHRIQSRGCNSLNFGFCEYKMPSNGKLFIYDPVKGTSISRPFTSKDNSPAKQLWTPIIPSCDVVIEVNLDGHKSSPKDLNLVLCSINVGYRGFGTSEENNNKPNDDAIQNQSGDCNVDVNCPAGNRWRNEIPSVGAISSGGSIFCTGFMVNNARQDRTPYFMTAYHCRIYADDAASLVVYWNYEASTCNSADGALSNFQTGSVFRAGYSMSDFVLVQLNADPDPAWGVSFAGWDRSGNDAEMAIGIHHPRGDEKKISFENDATTTTSYLSSVEEEDGTHIRVEDWDLGTTEGGSSGSPLFDQNHRVIGQLHGGYAACGNDDADWYGKISVSWNGGGTPDTRLRDWLDPANLGVTFIDTLTSAADTPTISPSDPPARSPTYRPTVLPTGSPTFSPMYPTYYPTVLPTDSPTFEPTLPPIPIMNPTIYPTDTPTAIPTDVLTNAPTSSPFTSSQTVSPTHSSKSKAGKTGKGSKMGKTSKSSFAATTTNIGTDSSVEATKPFIASSTESMPSTSTEVTGHSDVLNSEETVHRKRERKHESTVQ